MGLEQLQFYRVKKNLNPYLTSQINRRLIRDLNVKTETRELLERKKKQGKTIFST